MTTLVSPPVAETHVGLVPDDLLDDIAADLPEGSPRRDVRRGAVMVTSPWFCTCRSCTVLCYRSRATKRHPVPQISAGAKTTSIAHWSATRCVHEFLR